MHDHSTTEQAPLCACGCGQAVSQSQMYDGWNRFIRGHNSQPRSLADRFWEKVQKTDSCWIWTGAHMSNGYGSIGSCAKGRRLLAHRVSWELHNGPIPDGLCALHRCDNRTCVNPNHLFLGTYKDNALDMHAKGRDNHCKGETAPSTFLTNADVLAIRAEFAQGQRIADIARNRGLKYYHVSNIVHRKTWRHI